MNNDDLRDKLEQTRKAIGELLATWPEDGSAPDLDAIDRLSSAVLSVTSELDSRRLDALLDELDDDVRKPVHIYRMGDDGPTYVSTDAVADGDALAALVRRFGWGADIQIVENRPLEGDVWSVTPADGKPGRYLTRATLIEGRR
ncbi:MAG: hypothetical protein U5L04_05290 [Trueperaceae bacterium]|nr:hypothetical protein [Trueperaceae bacterium]